MALSEAITVGTTEAARLLSICTQRVRRLLKEGRIVGAEKVGRFWQIPLFNGIPKVNKGSRGPSGTWRKRASKTLTHITVNQHVIRSNKKNEENEPVVRVQQGSRTGYCHEVEITGKCRIIYSPNNPLGCGARVWIEVEPDVVVKPFIYADMTQVAEKHIVAVA
ncbi:MAG: helix-turn-helix domain-containing protein [Cyanobacteria bacterium J06628_3]